MSEEILNLSWKNHSSEFFHLLSALREIEKYTDVTLACEDQFYPSHKLILSTYSDYFLRIFDATPCKHPVIVLREVASRDLTAILSYMYEGRVSLPRSQLPQLIRAAKHLQIKGFSLSEEQLASTRKRPSLVDNEGSQQYKRQRKVKQENQVEWHESERECVGEDLGHCSTTSHVIVSRMKDAITAHQVPMPEEEILVETTIGEEVEGQHSHLQLDLNTESHLEQDYLDHNLTLSVQDDPGENRTIFNANFIKKEITAAELESHPLDLEEAEALHREQMHVVATQLAQCDKSLVLTNEKYEAILAHLRNPSGRVIPKFRHWVKNRRFCLMDLPELGLREVLAIPDRESLYSDDVKPRYLHVIPAYQAYDVVYQIHNHKLNHGGYKRVLGCLQRHYYGVTRTFVQTFCKTCPTCAVRDT